MAQVPCERDRGRVGCEGRETDLAFRLFSCRFRSRLFNRPGDDLVLEPLQHAIGPVLDAFAFATLAHSKSVAAAGVDVGFVIDPGFPEALHQIQQNAGVRVVGRDEKEGWRRVGRQL